jgi:hypothetical protein
MKNIVIKYFLFTFVCLLLIIGCKKDFLDVDPIGVINSNSFYSTKADAEQAVTVVYGMLNYMSCWDEGIHATLGSIASDDAEAGGNNADDSPDFQNVDRFAFTPSINPGFFAEAYGVLYKSIFYANIALERLPDIPTKDTSATEEFINQRLGEVKFLRALDYFYLVQIFGEIPLVDHVLGASEYTMGRSSLRSIFDLMEKDLQDAIPVLPEQWPSVTFSNNHYEGDDVGRVTKGAAQALLAKVYLFESSYPHYYPGDNYSLVNPGSSRFDGLTEKWNDALAMAENVINSGKYELVGIDGGKDYASWRGNTDGYRFIWTTNGNNSKEAVFDIQCEYLGLGWLATRGSAICWWTGARWIFNQAGTAGEAGYWGFNIPSASILAEFNQEQRHAGDPLLGSLTPADPRFNTTIHKDTIGGNDSINIGVAKKATWLKICYNYSPTQFNPTLMYQAKYECSYEEFVGKGASWAESPFNFRMIRYADIVLVAAEAAIMAGDNAKALTYINMVRKRARMCGPSGNTVPEDLTGSVTMDQLRHERRLELAMEGYRFFDLVRWNLATPYLSNKVLASGYTVNFTSPKNDFYPIPQTEVNTNPNLLQYPGW